MPKINPPRKTTSNFTVIDLASYREYDSWVRNTDWF